MNHIQGPLIYEGKAKRVFSCENPDRVLIEFKNMLLLLTQKNDQRLRAKVA